jgi:hypothetical protein
MSIAYPVATSDILPHLLHEHQVGFVNRTVEATYLTRTLLHEAEATGESGGQSSSAACSASLDTLARPLVRYMLFADEVPLPPGGVEGDATFKAAFLSTRRSAGNGASLKDFDLQKRLFRHPCSYMIYSPSFRGLPGLLKERVYSMLDEALTGSAPEFAYLTTAEKRQIRMILKETVDDLPAQWGSSR